LFYILLFINLTKSALMELASTVISLALAVKELSDTATENIALCQSLGRRAELIPRMLAKFPDMSEIDDKLLINLFEVLKQSHELISEYRSKGAFLRFLRSASLKDRFNEIEEAIAKCIDELTLCVGISSAAKIESIRIDFKNQFFDNSDAADEGIVETIEARDHRIDYTTINFELKRGIRREVYSDENYRSYMATLEGQQVVVREPVVPGKMDAALLARWRTDVDLLAELSHFSICHVLGGDTEYVDDECSPPETVVQLFVVMAYLPGGTLADHLAAAEGGGLSLAETLSHAHTLVSGLRYLHSCSPRLIHGALSPTSIYLDAAGHCRLTNILLRQDQLGVSGSTSIADTQWLSPEQAKGSNPTCASDMYTFGLLLGYMLCGVPPYASSYSSPRDIHEALVTGVRPHIPAGIDSFLQELIGCCLSVDAGRRPTAASVQKALLAACKEKGVSPEGVAEDEVARSGSAVKSGEEDDESDVADLGDFGDISDRAENIATSVTTFGRAVLSGGDATCPCVVAYGDKVVVLELSVSGAEPAVGAGTVSSGLDDEEEGEACGAGVSMTQNSPQIDGTVGNVCTGTVIFHIDCTASMKRDNRMDLTKDVLLRVIPSLLRQGLQVWINSWASNETTKGRIQTRKVSLPDPALLEQDRLEELKTHILSTAFEILVPMGRTDLYGSCFQLLRQCREVISTGRPVYAFVLTDGNHNRLDYPHHAPSYPGEDYFGVYKAVLFSGTKFGLSHDPFTIEYANNFLRKELDTLHTLCERVNEGRADSAASLSLTIIGIGDASTKSLSDLTASLGEKCCFYGITEVSQSDPAFGNISSGGGRIGNLVTIEVPGVLTLPLNYTVDDGDVICGCARVAEVSLIEGLIAAPHVTLSYKNHERELKAVTSTYSHAAEMSIKEFVSAIRQIRSECYVVTTESFEGVFKQLLDDKKAVWGIKTSFFSKKTRKLRDHVAFAGIGIWIRELEDLIDAQISSYRMNVEGEVLHGLVEKGSGEETKSSAASGAYFQPSDMVLERLQNNVRFFSNTLISDYSHLSLYS
jgi:serine/threonine protein kinase